MDWIAEKIELHTSQGWFLKYLGSFPGILTDAEYDRQDDIGTIAYRMGLILTVDHRNDRQYVFVSPSPWDKRSHRPDVSKLVFGELNTGDSEGYKVRTRPNLCGSIEGELPLSSFMGPWLEREGPCECKKFGCTPWISEQKEAA